ncbi:MAG: hypothetical protein M3137_07535 [Actinomycetota bacterium]|nr:hypothetical protein [Actinomycetota bacterium]
MNPPRDRVDQVLDTILFAPVGALLSIGELVAKLAERGRRDVDQAKGALGGLPDNLKRFGESTSGRTDQ